MSNRTDICGATQIINGRTWVCTASPHPPVRVENPNQGIPHEVGGHYFVRERSGV